MLNNSKAESISEEEVAWLLKSLREIKRQKQQRNITRVVRCMNRLCGLSEERVLAALKIAIAKNIVEKKISSANGQLTYCEKQDSSQSKMPVVSNQQHKGIPVRVIRRKKDTNIQPLRNPEMFRHVKAALRDCNDKGASFKFIENYIVQNESELQNHPQFAVSLRTAVKWALHQGRLIKSGPRYKLVPLKRKRRSDKCIDNSVDQSEDSSSSTKKSDNFQPRVIPFCYECSSSNYNTSRQRYEDLLSCYKCGSSCHPTCALYNCNSIPILREIGEWQCVDCKVCRECSTYFPDTRLVFCRFCDEAFHLNCHIPMVRPSQLSKSVWKCASCERMLREKIPIDKAYILNLRSTRKLVAAASTLQNDSKTTSTPQEDVELQSCATSESFLSSEDSNEARSLPKESMTNIQPPPTKPVGLIDGLTTFFTPSDKRTSRTGRSSLSFASLLPRWGNSWTRKYLQKGRKKCDGRAAAAALIQKSKISVEKRRRRNHLQGLQDGLSHLYQVGVNNGKTRTRSPNRLLRNESIPSVPIKVELVNEKHDVSKEPSSEVVPKAVTEVNVDKDRNSQPTQPPKRKKSVRRDFLKMSAKVDVVPKIFPCGVTMRDWEIFAEARKKAQEQLPSPICDPQDHSPLAIEFGKYDIQTWYSSTYPLEYRLTKLYICEFCLQYMKSHSVLEGHLRKCNLRGPPGNEIYRDKNLSVFEVDGNVDKIYCQNVCLLAKLFLDHKTLYYDVEPFLFYILACRDEFGFHFIGYFSKEKFCQQKYNLSCIMTLPPYQQNGYGRFLIDFSYLLSRVEGQPGSPEKPLSDLGKVSYFSYWKAVVTAALDKLRGDSISVKDIQNITGMCGHDIAFTLEHLLYVKKSGDRINLNISGSVQREFRLKAESRRTIKIKDSCLRWSPYSVKPLSPTSIFPPHSPLIRRTRSQVRLAAIKNEGDFEIKGELSDKCVSPVNSTGPPFSRKVEAEESVEIHTTPPKRKRGRPRAINPSLSLTEPVTPIKNHKFSRKHGKPEFNRCKQIDSSPSPKITNAENGEILRRSKVSDGTEKRDVFPNSIQCTNAAKQILRRKRKRRNQTGFPTPKRKRKCSTSSNSTNCSNSSLPILSSPLVNGNANDFDDSLEDLDLQIDENSSFEKDSQHSLFRKGRRRASQSFLPNSISLRSRIKRQNSTTPPSRFSSRLGNPSNTKESTSDENPDSDVDVDINMKESNDNDSDHEGKGGNHTSSSNSARTLNGDGFLGNTESNTSNNDHSNRRSTRFSRSNGQLNNESDENPGKFNLFKSFQSSAGFTCDSLDRNEVYISEDSASHTSETTQAGNEEFNNDSMFIDCDVNEKQSVSSGGTNATSSSNATECASHMEISPESCNSGSTLPHGQCSDSNTLPLQDDDNNNAVLDDLQSKTVQVNPVEPDVSSPRYDSGFEEQPSSCNPDIDVNHLLENPNEELAKSTNCSQSPSTINSDSSFSSDYSLNKFKNFSSPLQQSSVPYDQPLSIQTSSPAPLSVDIYNGDDCNNAPALSPYSETQRPFYSNYRKYSRPWFPRGSYHRGWGLPYHAPFSYSRPPYASYNHYMPNNSYYRCQDTFHRY